MPPVRQRRLAPPPPMAVATTSATPITLAEVGLTNINQILVKILNRKTFEALQACFQEYLPSYFDQVKWEKLKKVYSTLDSAQWLSKTLRLFSIFEMDFEQTIRKNQIESLAVFHELISLLFPFLDANNKKKLALDLISNIKNKVCNIYQIKSVVMAGINLNSRSLNIEHSFLEFVLQECQNTIDELRKSQRYRQNRANFNEYTTIIENINALKNYLSQYKHDCDTNTGKYFFAALIIFVILPKFFPTDIIGGDFSMSFYLFILFLQTVSIVVAIVTSLMLRKKRDRFPVTQYDFDHLEMKASLAGPETIDLRQARITPMFNSTPSSYFDGFNNVAVCSNTKRSKTKKPRPHIRPLKDFLIENCKSQIYSVEYSFVLLNTVIKFDKFNKTTKTITHLNSDDDPGMFLVGFLNDTNRVETFILDNITMLIPKFIIYLSAQTYQELVRAKKEKKIINVFSECSNNKNRVTMLAPTETAYRHGYRYKIKISSENFRVYAREPIEGRIIKVNEHVQKDKSAKLLCFDYIDWSAH